jgi:hypothetical protein
MPNKEHYGAARAQLKPHRFGVPKTREDLYAQLKLLAYTAHKVERSFRLDALETSLRHQLQSVDPEAETGFQLYGSILRSFARTDIERNRADNIRHCGTQYVVAEDEAGPALLQIRCRDRMCLRCQMQKYAQLADKTTARTKQMRFPKLLTLTLKANDQTAAHEITRLLKCFARLRRHERWKTEVKGGIYSVELVPRPDGRTHHVHLHAIIDCFFLDVRWLSKTWHKITGDSFQVDICAAWQARASYIAKYASKGFNSLTEGWNPWDVAVELKGRRLCGTFGNVPALCKDDPEPQWKILGSLTQMLKKAAAGDDKALTILEQAVQRANNQADTRDHPDP